MDRLIKLLKENNGIKDYKIINSLKHSYQLFYVKDKIEMARVSDSSSCSVTIYINKDNMTGSASFDYAEYMSEEEVKENIKEAVFNASLALNPYYEIPGPQDKPVELYSNIQEYEFKDLAEQVAEAIFSANMSDNCYSAATEIFIYKVDKHIINSRGLDNKETKYYGEVELIPTYEYLDKEVEIYHLLKFSNFDKDKITNEVNEVLALVKARFEAVDLPKDIKDINVILEGEELAQLFGDYFIQDLSYTSKFHKMNLFELDNSVTDNKLKLNVSLTPYVEGATDSRSFDDDGISLKEVELIKDGIAVARHGNYQFGYYLGVKNPTGNFPVVKVGLGDTPALEMRKEPYIRCARFSGLQVDLTTGFVGGEVRLGFYFDGEKEIPVTGFTISGNMHELRSQLVLSKESDTQSNYQGPKNVLLPKCKIA